MASVNQRPRIFQQEHSGVLDSDQESDHTATTAALTPATNTLSNSSLGIQSALSKPNGDGHPICNAENPYVIEDFEETPAACTSLKECHAAQPRTLQSNTSTNSHHSPPPVSSSDRKRMRVSNSEPPPVPGVRRSILPFLENSAPHHPEYKVSADNNSTTEETHTVARPFCKEDDAANSDDDAPVSRTTITLCNDSDEEPLSQRTQATRAQRTASSPSTALSSIIATYPLLVSDVLKAIQCGEVAPLEVVQLLDRHCY